MDNFEELAMKEEIMLDDDDLVNAPQESQSDDSHMEKESCEHQQSREETPQSALQAAELSNEFSSDAELMTALRILEDTAYLSDSDCEGHLSAASSDSGEEEEDSCVHQQRKEETPQSALGPSEGVNAALCNAEGETASVEDEDCVVEPELIIIDEESDAEVQSIPSAAGSSGQEERPEPRTEAQGAGQEDDGPSQRGTEPKFCCNICDTSFAQKSLLVDHMMLYSYVCETCREHFTSRRELNRHDRLHTREGPFQCDACGLCFALKSTLTDHVHAHMAAEKPFRCETCGALFADEAALATHVLAHMGKNRFICKSCGRNFTRKDSLQRHVCALSRKRLVYTCDTCGKRFLTKTKLRSHILNGHNRRRRKRARVSVKKKEEEECLARPELVICTNDNDDAEEPMEQELVDPLSTIDMKMEEDINSIKVEDSEEEVVVL